MLNQFSRFELMIGTSNLEKIKNKKVAIFGIGGVGGYVCESLARCGVSNFLLVDNDTVSITNINRQIIATLDSISRYKTEVMKERILSINDKASVKIINEFYLPETAHLFDLSGYDYIVDCVDTVSAKINLVLESNKLNIKIISAMGAGNKLDITKLEISDIYKTSVDPLARVMRQELKKRRIKKLKVAYSKEYPLNIKKNDDYLEELSHTKKRMIPASNAFVPSAMGLLISSEIIKDFINE